jgi:hypothetical protein
VRVKRHRSLFLATLLCSGWVTPVLSQVTIDVSKITCEQFTLFKIADPDNIALWVAGFYSGKRNKLTVDVQEMKANAKKLVSYCVSHPKMKMLDAVEPALGSKPQ